MSDAPVNNISALGMNIERGRLELAALKISIADISFSSMLEAENFSSRLNGAPLQGSHQEQKSFPIKAVADKANPMADDSGHIYKFDVDPTHEMATLISATRAYEANVRAYNANSQMNKAALEIGAK